MLRGTTKSGFNFTLKEEALDDYELFEMLVDLDAGDASKLPQVMKMLFGEKQKNRLIEHLKQKNKGRASLTATMEEVNEIFSLAHALKK